MQSYDKVDIRISCFNSSSKKEAGLEVVTHKTEWVRGQRRFTKLMQLFLPRLTHRKISSTSCTSCMFADAEISFVCSLIAMNQLADPSGWQIE